MVVSDRGILLVGGGGHCQSVLDSLLTIHSTEEIGIVDIDDHSVCGAPWVGTDQDLPQLFRKGWRRAVVTLGSVGDSSKRMTVFKKLREIGFVLPSIVDASAVVSRYAMIGQGVFVGKKACVNAAAFVGDGAILNSGSIVEHDAVLGQFVHISPGAVLCGAVQVGDFTHVGANATVIQGVRIGSSVMVGAGSVVLRDIASYAVAYGNPCREVNNR